MYLQSIKLRVQMCNIQRHIVSLGEKQVRSPCFYLPYFTCMTSNSLNIFFIFFNLQKKLLTQLRLELEADGGRSSSTSPLQNLRPNPLNSQVSSKSLPIKKELINIKSETNLNENTNTQVKTEAVPHSSRRKSKLVATPDVLLTNGHSTPSPTPVQKENTPSSTPSTSPTHTSSSVKQPKQRYLQKQNNYVYKTL